MRFFKKNKIQNKLFLIIIAILSINILVVLAFGTSLLDRVYMFDKKSELKRYETKIQQSYEKGDSDGLKQALYTLSANNVIALFYNQQTGEVIYSLADQMASQPQMRIDPQHWYSLAKQENIFQKLERESPIVITEKNAVSDSIFLYAKLNQDTYLFMETPRAYIEATAQTATHFFALLLLISLLAGIVITHFVAKKIAKPINDIQDTAQKIATMDFKKRCDVHTGDEIEALANSVNQMADQLEENIDLLKKDLEREEKTNRIRSDFVSNVSHDFKTPLSLIEAYSESIQDGSSEDIKQACSVIIEQSRRMNHLVNQLLTLSKLESGMIDFHIEDPFCLDELIQNILKDFSIILNKEKIHLQIETDSDAIVKGDFRQIEQVFTNLLENAVKYVDEKKEIRLFTQKIKPGMIRIGLYNSHPPLTESQRENLFEMFYKTDCSRSNLNSYGIGLTIVKTILGAHNQACGVYNEGEGVVFWFELPLIE